MAPHGDADAVSDIERRRGGEAERRGGAALAQRGRTIALIGLTALVAVFAVLNTESVEVNWIFGTFDTPLILLIVVVFGIGLALGYGGAKLERRRRRPPRA